MVGFDENFLLKNGPFWGDMLFFVFCFFFLGGGGLNEFWGNYYIVLGANSLLP